MRNYTEAAKKILDQQSVKGLQKYGITPEAAELSPLQWINHAQEESADFLIYLEALKDIFHPNVEKYAKQKAKEISLIEISVLKEAVENIRYIRDSNFTAGASEDYRHGIDRAITEILDMIEDTKI